MAKKQFKAGDTTTLTIVREGEEQTLDLTWDAAPKEEEKKEEPKENQESTTPPAGGFMDPWDMFNFFFG